MNGFCLISGAFRNIIANMDKGLIFFVPGTQSAWLKRARGRPNPPPPTFINNPYDPAFMGYVVLMHMCVDCVHCVGMCV